MSDYRQVPIPEPGRWRRCWTPLVDALIAARGKAVHFSDADFRPTRIGKRLARRGFRLRTQVQPDRSWIAWAEGKS